MQAKLDQLAKVIQDRDKQISNLKTNVSEMETQIVMLKQ